MLLQTVCLKPGEVGAGGIVFFWKISSEGLLICLKDCQTPSVRDFNLLSYIHYFIKFNLVQNVVCASIPFSSTLSEFSITFIGDLVLFSVFCYKAVP